MTLVMVGLSYHSAPVAVRERLNLSGAALTDALVRLNQPASAISEAVILSTCNRLEVYAEARSVDDGFAQIEALLADQDRRGLVELKSYLVHLTAEAAAEHLMRVASGLDSMIFGESQILGQIARAYEEAQRQGACGAALSHLFAQSIHAGKRAHTETVIGRFSTSVSHSGAALMAEALHGLPSRVLIVGAGEMAALAAQALDRRSVAELTFVSRTYQRARELAETYAGRALPWELLQVGLGWADAVLCATSAPHTVIDSRDVLSVMSARAARPLVIVDIAVPRDVEEDVRLLPGVRYYDIDDLQAVVDANLERRKAAVPGVEAIIQAELARFMEWYHGRQVTPVIRDLRDWAQTVATDELEETLSRLPDADDRTRQAVGRLAHRLVNRLLHEPTSRLRVQAAEGYACGYSHAVRELFALGESHIRPSAGDGLVCACAEHTGAPDAPCDLQCLLRSPDRPAV